MRLAIIIIFCAAAGFAAEAGYVVGNGVNLRASAASFSESLGTLKEGTAVSIVSEKDGWAQIVLPFPVTGWVDGTLLSEDGRVLQPPCPVYAGPGTHFSVLYMAGDGVVLPRTGRSDDRLVQVRLPEDATGWVSADFVRRGQPQQPRSVLPKGEAETELAQRRQELKRMHAEQLKQLQHDKTQLEELQQRSAEMKNHVSKYEAEAQSLQKEAERQEALREAAQARAKLAAMEREKAQLEESRLLEQLESEKKVAEEKARTVREDSARWQEEARLAEEKMASAKAAAARRMEILQQEASEMSAAEEEAQKRAREALAKADAAEKLREKSEQQEAETSRLIEKLQGDIARGDEELEMLRLRRESMAAATREENAKLAAMRAEAARLEAERREQAAQVEQARKEQAAVREQIAQLRAENEKQSAARAELMKLREDAQAQDAAKADLDEQIAAEKARLAKSGQIRRELEAELGRLKGQSGADAAAAEGVAASVADSDAVSLPPAAAAMADDSAPDDSAPEAMEEAASHSGVLLPLRTRTGDATHALCRDSSGGEVICYVGSQRLNLREWERRRVCVSGALSQIDGWKKPFMMASGIYEE